MKTNINFRYIVISIIVGIGGTFYIFKDLLLSDAWPVWWAGNFDARFIYWILNWGYHILYESRMMTEFWNANIFFPNSGTLALSDSLLSAQLLFTPLVALGIAPLKAMYLTLMGTLVISVLLTMIALRKMAIFSLIESIFIAFCAHFAMSISTFFAHYQLFGFHFAIPFFLFLYLFLKDFKKSYLIILCLLFVIGTAYATYLGPMLLVVSIFISIPVLYIRSTEIGIKELVHKFDIFSLLIVIVFAGILFFVQLKPYLEISQQFSKPSLEEQSIFSANSTSLFNGISPYSYWYTNEQEAWGFWEYAYFPGYALLTLGLGAIFLFVISIGITAWSKLFPPKSKPGNITDNHPNIDLVLFAGTLIAVSLVLSWGPYIKSYPQIRLPFYYLSKLILGLDTIRTPGRFGMFFGLSLGLLAVLGIQYLSDRYRFVKAKDGIVLGLLIVVMVESLPAFQVSPSQIAEREPFYTLVAEELPIDSPLIEIPIFDPSGIMGTINHINDQLLGSTIHWGRLVTGYGRSFSDEANELIDLDQKIQEGELPLNDVLNFGYCMGVAYYIINLEGYPIPTVQEFSSQFQSSPNINLLLEWDETILLHVTSVEDCN